MKENDEEFLQEVIDVLLNTYGTAESIDEATDFLSTSEVHTELSKLNPGTEIKPFQVYEIMREAGFKYNVDETKFSLSFKWMLKRK